MTFSISARPWRSAAAVGLAALLVSFTGTSCAHRIPLPEKLAAAGTPELLQRMHEARAPVDSYTAEARLTYYGRQERVRATASVAVERPASFRYDLMGPHGGVLEAFATNGRELQLVDMKSSRYLYGPATARNIDTLLPLVPLGLGPEAWVGLLFGEVPVPQSARLTYDDRTGLYVLTWEQDTEQRRVEVSPQTARVVSASVLTDGKLVSEVRVLDRDATGLPVELRLRAPEVPADVEVHLRDVATGVHLEPSVFTIPPPRGFATEHLDAVTPP